MKEYKNLQKDEDEQDTGEQDCGGRNMRSAEAQAKEAEKATEDDDECGQDPEKNVQDVAEGEGEGEGGELSIISSVPEDIFH